MNWRILGMAMLLAAGCVTSGAYDRKVAELRGVTTDHDRKAADEKAALQAQIDDLQKQLEALKAQLAACGTDRDHLKVSLDDATALISQLENKLEKLGQNVDKLTGERGQLAQ